jgi:hypothetical protein
VDAGVTVEEFSMSRDVRRAFDTTVRAASTILVLNSIRSGTTMMILMGKQATRFYCNLLQLSS